MRRKTRHPSLNEARRARSNAAGRLPAAFDRHLVEVDRMLQRQAGRDNPPAGLAERIFRASVGLLPGRAAPAPLRFPRRVHTSVWGQVAMAASVALAFAVAIWFHSAAPAPTPGGPSGGGSMAQRIPTPGPMTTPISLQGQPPSVAFHRPKLTLEAERLLYYGSTEVDYLLDTRDLTHAEMVDDLDRLLDELSEEL